MYLPDRVLLCIEALEKAGFSAYAVGGCVRDSLLGLTPQDYDLCTSATPEEICGIFSQYPLIRNGEKHGTIGVMVENTLLEITTFRTEGSYQDSRHPDWVQFVTSIEADLARRDFTVNAMAYTPKSGYVDPWGGQQDLQSGILRAVGTPSTRFAEDALRILRGVRFAVRYHLCVDPETEQAMFQLAPLLDSLARERVFEELCKLLPFVTAADLLHFCPIITQIIPELAASVQFCQHSPHHLYDVFTHTCYVTEATPADLPLRWAALLHDVAKPATFKPDETGRGHFYGHAQAGSEIADAILLRLKAPTALRKRVVFLIEHHMYPLTPDKKQLRRSLGKFGQDAVFQLLALQKADFNSKGTGTPQEAAVFAQIEASLHSLLEEDACLNLHDLAVSGNDLLTLGMPAGPQIGRCLHHLLEQVQQELLPNTKEALLAEAAGFQAHSPD